MAFPTTYNISYYEGDTYQFTLYPKTSAGAALDMTAYETLAFTISATRGGTPITATAALATGNTAVVCTIPPAVGATLSPGTTYVYDVSITDSTPDPDVKFTLATGTLSVTQSVVA